MRSAFLACVAVAVLSSSAALADEYTVTPFDGVFIEPPRLLDNRGRAAGIDPQFVSRLIGPNEEKPASTVTTPTLSFDFQFFGKRYLQGSKITVSEDGWLALGEHSANPLPRQKLPFAGVPEALVAAFWDDLHTGSRGSVLEYDAIELNPNGTAKRTADGLEPVLSTDEQGNTMQVISWIDMDTADRDTNDRISFQVVLHRNSGIVDIVYDRDLAERRWAGTQFTTPGIQSDKRTNRPRRVFHALDAPQDPDSIGLSSGRPQRDLRFIPNTVTISGTITRDRPAGSTIPPGATGLANLPVAGARVILVPEDSAELDEVIDSTTTTSTGTWTLRVLGLDDAPSLAVFLLAVGDASDVVTSLDVTGKTRRLRLNPDRQIDPTGAPGNLDVRVLAEGPAIPGALVDAEFAKALNVQQTAHFGFLWAKAALPTTTIPQVKVLLDTDPNGVSGYSTVTTAHLRISDRVAGNPDAVKDHDVYDDDVILREYGQHVLATIAKAPGDIVRHQWLATGTPIAATAAFADGFSFWFSSAVRRSAQLRDSLGASPRDFDLDVPTPAIPTPVVPRPDAPTAGIDNSNVTGAVAASLWDLVDSAIVAPSPVPDDDDFAGSLPTDGQRVLQAIQRIGAAQNPVRSVPLTIRMFFDEWIKRPGATQNEAAARQFIRYATLPDDTNEPDDKPAGKLPDGTPDPAQPDEARSFETASKNGKATGLVLNPANEDRFTFLLGDKRLAVAVNYPEAADVEVRIEKLDGTLIDADTSPETPPKAPVVAHIPTSAGADGERFVVRVINRGAVTARYTLAVTEAPALHTAALPEWTVGQAFRPTGSGALLSFTGTRPGMTFALSPAIPGMTLVSDGSRVTGTPLAVRRNAVGDVIPYVVDVMVTDSASGAGQQSAGTLTFLVNPQPSLKQFVGVAAGKVLAAPLVLGSGGTNTTWTVDTPGAGNAVPNELEVFTEGFELKLRSKPGVPAGAAQAFTITAHALDVAGATLLTEGETETCVVVVCRDLDQAASLSRSDMAKPFGFAFDALEGSSADLDFTFTGTGKPPEVLALVTSDGTSVPLPSGPGGVLRETGGHVRIRGLELTERGTHFLLFDAAPKFAGRIRVGAPGVLPPSRISRTVQVDTTMNGREALRFVARTGTRGRIVLRSGNVPDPILPSAPVTLVHADGTSVPLVRVAGSGDRLAFTFAALPKDGEYVLRISGTTRPNSVATTGPVECRVSLVPPRKQARFL